MKKIILDFIHDNAGEIFLTLLIILILGGIGWGVSNIMDHDKALMEQCRADGNKQYECVGILRGRR